MKAKRVTFTLKEENMEVLNQYRQKHVKKSIAECINDGISRLQTVSDPLIDDNLLKEMKQYNIDYAPDSSLKECIHALIKAGLPSTKEEFLSNVQKEDTTNKCIYRAVSEVKGVLGVDCGRLLSKKGKMIRMSLGACDSCWKRRQWVLKQKGTPTPTIRSNGIYCAIKDRYLQEIIELPCIKDVNYICPNTKCHDAVLKLMK